ncbi:hypothetical protein KXX32_002055, partial [Aspergillus fumigatus]
IRPLHGGCPVEVTFPHDCIEVLRCRPFRFSHRVVNKWFAERTILIGDAAHVFPPFGGQGVACGVQDAVGLAWRLAILTKIGLLAHSRARQQGLLQSWAMQLACLNIVQVFLGALGLGFGPFGADSQGYRGCVGGEFSMEHGGGIKLGQVYVQTRLPDSPTLKIEL